MSPLHGAVRGLVATGGVDMWSDAMRSVAREAPDADILDWGLYNNLYVVTKGRTRSRELFWSATAKYSGRGVAWQAEIARGGAYLEPSWILFTEPRAGFQRALRESGQPYTVRTF